MAGSPRVLSLMISADYVPSWTVWEGVRELVQNWYDGILQSYRKCGSMNQTRLSFDKYEKEGHIRYVATVHSTGQKFSKIISDLLMKNKDLDIDSFERSFIEEMEVEERGNQLGMLVYDRANQVLNMINFDTEISEDSLLIGATSKSLHHQSIGQFGEGMKIGALALARSNCRVLLETGGDRWEFLVRKHECLPCKVLSVRITDRQAQDNLPPLPKFVSIKNKDMCTQIQPLSEKHWLEFAKKFLFLENPRDAVDTDSGSLLLDPHLAGDLFIKQIWIKSMRKEHLLKGVDIGKELLLDRDRRCAANHAEVEHAVNIIWSKAVKRRPELHGLYFNLLSEKDSQLCDIKYAEYYVEDSDSIDYIAKAFFERHGNDAYPVLDNTTHDTMHRLENEFKKRTVYVSQSLHAILQRSYKLTAIDEMLNSRSHTVRAMSDLSEDETSTLHHGLGIVGLLEADFPCERIDLIEDIEQEVTMNSRNGHYEVPVWMLNAKEVHQRCLSGHCSVPADKCMCASAYFALQVLKHRTSQVPNPMMRLYGLANHLVTQSDRGAAPFCLHIHKHPPLTAAEKQTFSAAVKAKEQELLQKKKEFERALEEKSHEQKQILKDMEQRLASAKSEATASDFELFTVITECQKRTQEEQEKYQKCCQELINHYKDKLDYLLTSREDLLKQRMHVDGMFDKLKDSRRREINRSVKEMEERKSRMDWLRDILLKRLKAFIDLHEASFGTSLCDRFTKVWESFSMQATSDKMNMCITCCQKKRDVWFEPCGHCVMCEECTKNLNPSQRCPLCKKDPVVAKKMKLGSFDVPLLGHK